MEKVSFDEGDIAVVKSNFLYDDPYKYHLVHYFDVGQVVVIKEVKENGVLLCAVGGSATPDEQFVHEDALQPLFNKASQIEGSFQFASAVEELVYREAPRIAFEALVRLILLKNDYQQGLSRMENHLKRRGLTTWKK